MNETVVFSLSNNEELGKEICKYLEIKPGEITISHFKDGETLVELGQTVRGKKVYFIQSTSAPVNDNLMELLIAVDCAKRSSARDIVCVIPYFGYARQDRKAKPRQPITARLIADLLSAAGANRVVTIDLHAAQIQGFFSFPVDDLTTIPMMGHYIIHNYKEIDNMVVVSPDHGGVTRARRLAETLNCPIAIVDKRRPRPNVCEATSVIGDVKGKHCVIVDDICDTGGSLIASTDLLLEDGALDVKVILAHGVFSNGAIENIEKSKIQEVLVTNTIPMSEEKRKQTSKIKIISVGLMLSKIIAAISMHKPVSEVYNLFSEYDNSKTK